MAPLPHTAALMLAVLRSTRAFVSPPAAATTRVFGSSGFGAAAGFRPGPFFRQLTTPLSTAAPSEQGQSESANDEKKAAKAAAKAAKKAADEAAAAAMVLPTNENSDKLLRIRHTSAHVMAMAVQRLFPEVQVTIGPWIDNGFYYDFFNPGDEQFSETDLKAIQKEMTKIIKEKHPITREEVSREEARARIEAINEPYKLEILDSIKTEPITIYHIGDQWWDLCAGPHVETTGDLPPKAIQLQSVAGAYWRGDETRDMLQRIYGTAWEDAGQLKVYKKRMEEAKKRDHRVLGKKLDLFSIQEDAGGGLVFWHPKGSTIRRGMEDFWKEAHEDAGYDLLYTPHIVSQPSELVGPIQFVPNRFVGFVLNALNSSVGDSECFGVLAFSPNSLALTWLAPCHVPHWTDDLPTDRPIARPIKHKRRTWTCGRRAGTSTSTRRACSTRWRWRATSTRSSP